MSDIILKLLELIDEGLTINEISEVMNLSNNQIFSYEKELRDKGFVFNRKYLSSGDIIYVSKRNFITNPNDEVNLYTPKGNMQLKFLVISDLHIANLLERHDFIAMFFNYCISENIHIIISGGDFIDGLLTGSGKKKYDDAMNQISYALKAYPQDKSIITFTVLGNHDESTLLKAGIDFAEILKNNRHDIVPIGYGKGRINVKNDIIIVKHKLSKRSKIQNPEIPSPSLVIKGHSHKMGIKTTPNNLCIVSVPTCSDIIKDNFLPGAIKMTLSLQNGIFDRGLFEQLVVIDNKIVRVNEIEVPLYFDKELQKEIKYEEDRPKRLILYKK